MAPSEATVAAIPRLARESLSLVTLSATDIDGGLALSDAAGWNQTASDWAIFIRDGRAIGFRDETNRIVATAATLKYGASAGWVSMVLVADAWRHRGLAGELMAECVAHLRATYIVPVLDATPAGAAVYARIGFAAGFEIDRWEWKAASATADAGNLLASHAGTPRAAESADFEVLVALDRAATGLDRRFLIEDVVSRPGTSAWLNAAAQGFVVAREGRRAMQIGPLVAEASDQAIDLLATAFASARAHADRVFLDVPRDRRELSAWLEAQGFARQRPFVRMALGAAHAAQLGAASFALAGPEFG